MKSSRKGGPSSLKVKLEGRFIEVRSQDEAKYVVESAPAGDGGVTVEIENRGIKTLTGRLSEKIEALMQLLRGGDSEAA